MEKWGRGWFGTQLLQLKSTPTLPLPKMIKNDSERIATHLQFTKWLYYAILLREAWIFFPDLQCSTLGTAEFFTIAWLSRPLQGLPCGYYQIHCRAFGSAVLMHLKAFHRIYLSKSQTWRKEAGHMRGGRRSSS
jgi:hypothetical protein